MPTPVQPWIHHNKNNDVGREPTKIEQAIAAACQAVDHLRDGDHLSLVAFNETSNVVFSSLILDAQNRGQVKGQILSMVACGSTNLHAGWLMGAEQVTQALDVKKLNRVLVLSDGQTNSGKVGLDEICTDVSRLNEAGVSTSTFGIGDGFNEDLLEKMAGSGCGNFYFIENEGQLSQWFAEEFQGLSQMIGQAVKIEFSPGTGVRVLNAKNEFQLQDGKWLLPNLLQAKPLDILFSFELDRVKSGKKRVLGTFTLSYRDGEGQTVTHHLVAEAETATKKEYEAMDVDHEVQVVNTLLEVAKAKRLATRQMSSGDFQGASGTLRGSMMMASSVSDQRTLSESASLNAVLENYDSSDKNLLRKSLVSQAYNTRTSN